MVKIRPLIQVLGKIIKLPKNSYLDPETLGSGTTDATTVLKGDGTWGTPSSMGYVPYVGATQDVDLGIYKLSADAVEFSLTPTNAAGAGQIVYDGASGALSYLLNNSNVVSRIGQTMHAYVHNAEAVTITKGQAVYLFSASGNKASVKLAFNTSDATSAKTFGLAAENIGAGQNGMVICQGVLDGLNTGMYVAGNILYLGSTPGGYTATKPYAPNHMVYIGIVERANAGNGQIYVRVQNGYELDEIHDVDLVTTPPTTGNVLTYNGTLWVPQAPGGGGLTVGTTAIASGTVGRILFQNGGNVLGQDSALFWDNTNKRLGIGATPSTSVRLDVRAQGALSTDIAFRVRNSADTANIFTIQGNTLTQIGDKDVAYTPLTEKLLVTGLRNTDVIAKLYGGGTTNASLTELQLGGFNSPVLNIGTTYSNPTNRFTTAGQIQLSNNSLTNLVFGNSGTNTRGWGFYYTTAGGVTAENQVVAQITRYGTLSLGNTDVREYTESNTLIVKTGTNPSTNDTDSFKLYSSDRGGTAGKASAHFRAEDGTINVIGDLSGFGTSTPGARLDVRAQGALSTDIAFRVRNSANTFNLLSIDGVGLISGRTDGAGGFNMNYGGIANQTVQLTFNNTNPTLRVAHNNGHAFNVYASTDNREYLAGLIGKATFAIGANPIGGTIKPNEANTNTLYIFNGTAPTLSATDSFNMYSADIVAGNAAPHFRTENGSIIKLFQGAALTASDGTLANAVTRIGELEARLQAHGLIA